ncbi:hypothetical protein, partial [Eggerthella hominis]|uniref:hypothetical protein n=1 Tax=Eggerthella hominis TaxID=2763043 RepID=UPI001C9AC464
MLQMNKKDGITGSSANLERLATAGSKAAALSPAKLQFVVVPSNRQRRERCRRKETVMAKIVSSWNDWDPLKRVIVGRCDYS